MTGREHVVEFGPQDGGVQASPRNFRSWQCIVSNNTGRLSSVSRQRPSVTYEFGR